MKPMSIALPKALESYVREQVSTGEYDNASAYICQLIEEDRKHKARKWLDAALQDGLDSGDSIEVTPQFWEERRRELKRRLSRKVRKCKQ